MRKPKSISDETKRAVLEAAWDLIAAKGRADVGMAEIATAAGVSRQAVFYAFGGRAGLLLAMVRHKDRLTDHVARLRARLSAPEPDRAALADFAGIWLDYLPLIYPVGILLDAAALTDAEAAAAWHDRMIEGLLGAFRQLAARVNDRDPLPLGPARTADELWAAIHPTMWRRLVVDCGWTPEAFRASRTEAIRAILRPGA